jgi:HAE1 family hydrophobic/amphiphilic exporter-1
MLLALYSPKGTYNGTFLANYAYINLVDQLTRVPGIGNVAVFGAGQYAMRLWVKTRSVGEAWDHRAGHHQRGAKTKHGNPAGQVGGEPIPSGQKFTYTVRAQGRLQTPEEFGNIVVRANSDGSFVRVKDIARIELGAQTYNLKGRLNGQPSAIIACYQLPGTNAVEAAAGVRKLMADAKQRFPSRHGFDRGARSNTRRHRRHAGNCKNVAGSARPRCLSSFSFFSRVGAPPLFLCVRCRSH